MLILRPVARGDLDDLLALADRLDSMNLPNDPEFIGARVDCSIRSFRGEPADWTEREYVFVLEDERD